MSNKRIIARIDVKNEFAIKGIHLEGLRKVGDPNDMAIKYYNQGVDEIIFMDAVAAYYDRNSLSDLIVKATENVFVPITVGGGIRTLSDISKALKSGADKVAINTQGVRTPEFVTEAASVFGSQCIVASVEAKKISDQKWEVYVDNGRETTGVDVVEWVDRLEHLGAGEIMLTSIDMEGTKKGFDESLINAISSRISIPLIVCGGAGSYAHIENALSNPYVDAVALASVLHYDLLQLDVLKKILDSNGVEVRI
jgi:cyclase